jgi:DNA-directed RNA polymerase subunit beta'
MAYFSPEESFEVLKQRTAETVKAHFPVEGAKQTLVAKKVWVEDKKHIDDIEGQLDARLKGRSWSVPVKAQIELRDNKTGKVKDRKTVTVAQLPKVTNRYSHIVDGNEWQVSNQFRLKSGVYTRVKDNGELTSQWNLAKGRGFSMDFDPESKKMTLGYGTSNIPLYPVLKTMGVSDDDIERRWGKEVLAANRKPNPDRALMQLHKVMTGKAAANLDEAKNEIAKTFGETELRPDSTKLTLGKPFSKVEGNSLLHGSDKLLKVSRQEVEPDDRDALEFKDLWSSEDLIQERLGKDARLDISRRIKNNVDRKKKVAEIVGPDTFGKPLKQFFTNSSLSERPDQRNPIGFLVGARKTTVMGKHGIEEERKITLDAQSINPSHMGFLDPVHTPEGKTIGVTLQMSSAAKKVGKDLKIPVYNVKTGKKELIDPGKAKSSVLAFSDQFKWEKGKPPTPRGATLKVSNVKGDVSTAPAKDVQYVLPSTKGMFDISTNMIPFLQSDQGNRTMVAARQAEQAVPLIHREAPLVQVKTEAGTTFEGIVGKLISHRARVEGEVTRVGKDGISIRDAKGKIHKVPLYDDFPLNDNKSVVSSTPLVKKGDKVRAGQTVADSSFTKDGTLAMGSNLRVAYMPYKGLNFEDGVVISESAAKKMTSEHMHRHALRSDANTTLNKKKFLAETAGQITSAQADKLDDDSVVKPGQIVESGDVLIGTLKKETLTPEQKQLALFSRKAAKPVKPHPTVWDKDYPGVVSRVVKHGKNTTVYVKTATPAEVGDKMVGRHGNKGIITAILPDGEMPKTKDGKGMEVLLNPAGVPGRINLGQIMETAAAKVAEKTGKTYAVNNFDPNNTNYSVNLQKELKKHGVSDTEEMVDAQTGKSYGKVLTGPQYIYKLHHTVDKKRSARSRGAYTLNRTPQRGGTTGGQSMDVSGQYALLAHGAREAVRESQTLRSDMNDDMWTRIQEGGSVPAPKVPFAYKKFEAMLKGAGIDVKKDGNHLQLEPMTDKKVLELSNGEIKDPGRVLRAKDAQPENGGLFDPIVTGTAGIHKMGDKWSHIRLSERMPNPTFEKPVRVMMGLNEREFAEVMAGKRAVSGQTSARAVVNAMGKIDVDKDLKALEKSLPTLRGAKLNSANMKAKYLRGLKKAGMSAKDAYTMKYVPVLPPTMRPIAVQPTGDLNEADLNGLYSRAIGAPNYQLRTFDKALPPEEKHELVEALYDGLKSTQITGMTHKNRYRSGIVEQISGARKGSPKEGFFQKQVMGRRQDLSMRSTIVPDPSLNLDEVALPRKAAAEIYKPFVVSRMRRMGFTPLEAQKAIKENSPTAMQALKAEAAERPVLLKRDPVLHKYGVQAFKPRLVEGKTIKIHPLVTSGYNADFDGDQMSAFVPVSPKAVREAHDMFPSNNLFSSSHGEIMYKPGHEATLGLYKMTEMGNRRTNTFNTAADAARAVKDGLIDMTDVVSIKNVEDVLAKVAAAARPTRTTVGRLLVYNALPKEVRDDRLLTDPKYVMGKRETSDTLTATGKKARGKFAATADRLKDLGNEYSTGMSMGLEDFTAVTEDRDVILRAARAEEARLRKSARLTPEQKEDAVIGMYTKAGQEIEKRSKAKIAKSGNRMYDWVKSGARGDWQQFKQLAVAPLLVVDSKGKTVPVPIDRSYSEGLDAAGYWTSMHGARMGTISKAQGTEMPGALTKQLIRTSITQNVVSDDCKTSRGIAFNVDDPNALDRYTAKPIDLGTRGGKAKGKIPSGTLVTPELMSRLKNNKVKEVPVRTPLKCAHGSGICAKCMGLSETGQKFEKGTNVGIRAAHALGEPATQMSMNAFHTGGVAGGRGSDAVSQFTRLKQLTEVPKTLPGAATLAAENGKVENIEEDAAGGWSVYVGDQRHFVPGRRRLAVEKGQSIRKGDALSSGPKNPHEMLPLTGLGSVQRYMTDEIQKLYPHQTPLHRRNTEVVVRAMTNLSLVNDPGAHPDLLQGDRMPTSKINAFNGQLGSGKRPVQHTPVLKGTNVLPNEMQEDWLARMQNDRVKDTLLQGVAKGWSTDLHGNHPIPGMAYGAEFGTGTETEPWLY